MYIVCECMHVHMQCMECIQCISECVCVHARAHVCVYVSECLCILYVHGSMHARIYAMYGMYTMYLCVYECMCINLCTWCMYAMYSCVHV